MGVLFPFPNLAGYSDLEYCRYLTFLIKKVTKNKSLIMAHDQAFVFYVES